MSELAALLVQRQLDDPELMAATGAVADRGGAAGRAGAQDRRAEPDRSGRAAVINGLRPRLIRRAPDGEHVGTIISAEGAEG
jgi:hypothetical protein